MDSAVISWIIAGLGFVLDAAIVAAITAIVTHRIEKRNKERDAKEEQRLLDAKELENRRKAEDEERLKTAMANQCQEQICNFRIELRPIIERLGKIEGGTLSGLRDDILTCYYRCLEKGYRNDWDYTNIHDLHDAYTTLGGNSFIADIMTRFDNLPTKEEHDRKKGE